MKKIFFNRLFAPVIFFVLSAMPLPAANISGGHRGDITSLIHNGDTVISAGEDGFIVIWNIREQAATDRFQLTPYRIQTVIKHPSRAEICIIEAAGLDDYRISAWNYRFKDRLFSVRSAQPVTYVNYSAGGNFIIASGFNGFNLALLDSGTGEVISTPRIPEGEVTLGITGRNERTALLYQPETGDYLSSGEFGGLILYLDLEHGASVTGNFQTTGSLSNPFVFGNNRFLAGTSRDGLVVIDAASGQEDTIFENIERGALLCPVDNGFFCFNPQEAALYRFTVSRNGRITSRRELTMPRQTAEKITAFAYNGSVAFASKDGNILIVDRQNKIVPLAHKFRERVTEIAASKNSVAFLTESGDLCFIPLDFRQLERNQTLTFFSHGNYTRITASSLPAGKGADQFILWQSANTQFEPRIVYSDNHADETSLRFMLGRFPLRSISSKDGRLLVLDSAGNTALYNLENMNSRAAFTFSSIGAIDLALVNNENFIICRSVIRGNSPFLFVNSKTGETVPVSVPAEAGILAYTGRSPNVYAAAVERNNSGLKTSVINLSAASPVRIFEYPGEALNLSLAESAGALAIACGGEGAALFPANAAAPAPASAPATASVNFERTEGLPVKLLGCDEFFLCLDSEGGIGWFDNKTARLLALFRLYEDGWTLLSDKEISGSLSRP